MYMVLILRFLKSLLCIISLTSVLIQSVLASNCDAIVSSVIVLENKHQGGGSGHLWSIGTLISDSGLIVTDLSKLDGKNIYERRIHKLEKIKEGVYNLIDTKGKAEEFLKKNTDRLALLEVSQRVVNENFNPVGMVLSGEDIKNITKKNNEGSLLVVNVVKDEAEASDSIFVKCHSVDDVEESWRDYWSTKGDKISSNSYTYASGSGVFIKKGASYKLIGVRVVKHRSAKDKDAKAIDKSNIRFVGLNKSNSILGHVARLNHQEKISSLEVQVNKISKRYDFEICAEKFNLILDGDTEDFLSNTLTARFRIVIDAKGKGRRKNYYGVGFRLEKLNHGSNRNFCMKEIVNVKGLNRGNSKKEKNSILTTIEKECSKKCILQFIGLDTGLGVYGPVDNEEFDKDAFKLQKGSISVNFDRKRILSIIKESIGKVE